MIRRMELGERDRAIGFLSSRPELYAYELLYCRLYWNARDFFIPWGQLLPDGSGELAAMVLGVGENAWIAASPAFDPEEMGSFLSMSLSLREVAGEKSVMERLLPHLAGDAEKAVLFTLRNADSLGPEAGELREARGIEEFRQVHDLLSAEPSFDMPAFDRYYSSAFYRRREAGASSFFLEEDGKAVCTASVLMQTPEAAVVHAVTTREDCRGRGLAARLLSSLCRRLLGEGKQVYLTCRSEPAMGLYRRLGFTEAAEKLVVRKRTIGGAGR